MINSKDELPGYVEGAEQAVERIMALIPSNPRILTMENPWELFTIDAFKVSDLGLSAAQAGWALKEAKVRYDRQPK